MSATNESLLEIRGLRTHFFGDQGVVRAVDGVDMTVPRGKTLCVVGESGSGKSMTARSIMRLVDKPGRIVSGSIVLHRSSDSTVDIADLPDDSRELRAIRGNEIAMIFQEPMSSFSPVHTIGDQIVEAIQLHMPVGRREARERAIAMLDRVGIPRPRERLESYSFQLSGGMCQRAMIAMALACEPDLLIADEPTTALDVTTQANILDLVRDLQQELGMSVMFITHDLGVVAEIADEVSVMYLGTTVERGDVFDIFEDPKHPYTRALLQSIPKMGVESKARLEAIAGMVPHPLNRPPGCPFHTRCDAFIPGSCDRREPPAVALSPRREVRCLLHGDATGEESDAEMA